MNGKSPRGRSAWRYLALSFLFLTAVTALVMALGSVNGAFPYGPLMFAAVAAAAIGFVMGKSYGSCLTEGERDHSYDSCRNWDEEQLISRISELTVYLQNLRRLKDEGAVSLPRYLEASRRFRGEKTVLEVEMGRRSAKRLPEVAAVR